MQALFIDKSLNFMRATK